MDLLENPFSANVIKYIKKIPKGKVATYGQIAVMAGKPQGARGVSWILHSSSRKYKLPWHRVINSQGKISFDKKSSNYSLQKRRLKQEGVVFDDLGRVDLSKYRWD